MLNDCFSLAGFACLVYGAGQVYQPAGWLVAGVAMAAVGVGGAIAKRRREKVKPAAGGS